MLVLTSGQSLHCWSHKVELLLQVVEADHSIDAVPVQHSIIYESRLDQLAVNLLFVKDIEECLEKDYRKYEIYNFNI